MFENHLKVVPNTVIEIKDLTGTFKSTGEFVCTDPCYTESRLFTKLENMKPGKYSARLGLFVDKEDLFDRISSIITNKLFQLILNETKSHKIGLFYLKSLSDKAQSLNLYKLLYEYKINGIDYTINEILKVYIDKFVDFECDHSELSYIFLYDLIKNNLYQFKESLSNIIDLSDLNDDYLIKAVFMNAEMLYINIYSMSSLDVLYGYVNGTEKELEKDMYTRMYNGGIDDAINNFDKASDKKRIVGNRVAFLQVKHIDDLEYIPYKDDSWKFVEHNHYIDSGQVGIFDAKGYGKMDEDNKDYYYSDTMKLTLDSGNHGGIHKDLKGAVSSSSYGDLSFSIFVNDSRTQIMCEHVMDEEYDEEDDGDDDYSWI